MAEGGGIFDGELGGAIALFVFVAPNLAEVAVEFGGGGGELLGEVDADAVGVDLESGGFVDGLSGVTDAVEAAVLGGVVAPAIEPDEVELAVFWMEGTTHGASEKFAFERDGGALGAGAFVIAEDEVVEAGAVGEAEVGAFERAPFIGGDLDHAADRTIDSAWDVAEGWGDCFGAVCGAREAVEFALVDFDNRGGGSPGAFLGGDPEVVLRAADAHAVADAGSLDDGLAVGAGAEDGFALGEVEGAIGSTMKTEGVGV